jgi:putative membrane protein
MKILIRFLVIAVALAVAAWLVPGIRLTGHDHTKQVETLLIVAAIFGVINVVLKPIIKTVGCAFYVLTLGLFALVVNGALLLLTSWIAYDKLHEPFHVLNFFSAVIGALIVSVISWLAHLVIPDDGDRRSLVRGGARVVRSAIDLFAVHFCCALSRCAATIHVPGVTPP